MRAPRRRTQSRHRSAKMPVAPAADLRWWQPFATVGNAVIDHVDLTPHTAREASALEWLDEEECARWHRYRHPRPKRQFVLCRAALRAILCERLGCGNDDLGFATSDHGKPIALVRGTPARVHFNVSHGGAHGLIALAGGGRIGVDIEERTPRHDPDGAIAKAFAPEERRALAAAEGDCKIRLFFRLWTCKEALIKGIGSGFSLDSSSFEIPVSMYHRRGPASRAIRRAIFRFPHLPKVRWRLEDLSTADFAAAVAHELTPHRDHARATDQ